MNRVKMQESYAYERMRMIISYGHTHTYCEDPSHAHVVQLSQHAFITFATVCHTLLRREIGSQLWGDFGSESFESLQPRGQCGRSVRSQADGRNTLFEQLLHTFDQLIAAGKL